MSTPETETSEGLSAELAKLTFTDEEAPKATAPEPEPLPAEPEPSPAPVEAAKPASEPGKVPVGALIEERNRRRALEARLAELERAQQQPQPQPQPQPQQIPQQPPRPEAPDKPTVTFEENPAEFLRQQTEIAARKAEALEKDYRAKVDQYEAEQRQIAERHQMAEAVARLDDEYRSRWSERAQADPSALDAHRFWASSFLSEARAAGYTEPQAQQMLVHAERTTAYQAFNADADPVDLIVARAQARGWQPTAAVQPRPPAAPPAASAASTPTQAEKRASASRSLSGASGAAVAAPSLKDFADMSADEYAAYRKKHGNPLLAAGMA